jgi:hypothetical protein
LNKPGTDAFTFMNMNRLVIVSIASFSFLIGGVLGCNPRDRILAQQKEVIQQSEELSKSYLQGDIHHAKESLLKDAKLLEGATILEPGGRAYLLRLTYLRMCVLQKRTGNEAAADVNLIKAQYWSLPENLTEPEMQKVISEIKQLNLERASQYVDEFDRLHNDGKEPAYIGTIHK